MSMGDAKEPYNGVVFISKSKVEVNTRWLIIGTQDGGKGNTYYVALQLKEEM